MAELNQPVNLYPPDLLPTREMASVFAPGRVRPWQHPLIHSVVETPMVSSKKAMPSSTPSSSNSEMRIVSPPSISSSSSSSASFAPVSPSFMGSHGTVTHLSATQVDGILTVVRSRPENHPHRQSGTGRMGSIISGLFGTVRPSDITLNWLRDQHVTLRELLVATGLRISITDLISAGIVRTFGDLLALDFKATDLTLRRDCFNCAHFKQFFNGSYRLLAQTLASGGFTMKTLIEADPSFTCDDLQTLGVRVQHLVIDDDGGPIQGFDYKLLGMVGLGPVDWMELGLESKHILAYGITAEAVQRKLFWDPREVARVFEMPNGWLEGR